MVCKIYTNKIFFKSNDFLKVMKVGEEGKNKSSVQTRGKEM